MATNATNVCPKTRFGKTEVMISTVTCGGMRLQQTWNRGSDESKKVTAYEQVDAECQRNLVAIIRSALAQGINHFETAQGYGCSEIQFGEAFKEIFAAGDVKREDIILQTKAGPRATPEAMRTCLEDSFKRLQVDTVFGGYIDFFSYHGINREKQVDHIANTLCSVTDEFVASKRIRHIGFSTHGQPATITRAINTGKFGYVNLHYDFIGSYTASGSGKGGRGTLECVEAAAALDMGVFIISPYDKGGKLYKPPAKFTRLCEEENGLTPIEFNTLWLLQHTPACHTLVVGAARPTDFDLAVRAASLLNTPDAQAKVSRIEAKLNAAAVEAHGAAWAANWAQGLPNCFEAGGNEKESTGVFVTHMVWLHFLVKAWGFLEFGQDRWGELAKNASDWNNDKTFEENTEGWGFCPGSELRPGVDIAPHLTASSDPAMALTAVKEAQEWCSSGGVVPASMAADCAPAYDLQPDVPYPERKDIKDPHTRP